MMKLTPGRIAAWLVLFWFAVILLPAACAGFIAAKAEPLAARQYRNDLIREVHAQWGLNVPVAVIAGQLEQESGWKPNVCSAVACGLAQFTGPTAKDMAKRYASLGSANVFDPAWALRAAVLYDRDLYNATEAADDCNHWAFALSAYNGGLGNVRRDVRLCTGRCDARFWFGGVALRSNRSAAAFRENRAYPARILFERQHSYISWGSTVSCGQS